MAKFISDLSFTAHIEIEAKDAKEAKIKAQGMLDARSVYEDDRLDDVIDKAYCAGGTAEDPPLLNGQRAYELRDKLFEAEDPVVRLEIPDLDIGSIS